MKKLFLLLLVLVACVRGVLPAQTFDLSIGRVPVASLDGLWRFHTGDNPAWADPNFDDSKWPLLRSDKDWSSQGYKGYGGLAWYRFQVNVPAGMDHVSLFLPRFRTCYEVYADGKLIGAYGKMPPNLLPYTGGGDFQVYSFPPQRQRKLRIDVALRVWHSSGWAIFYGGGPQYGGGFVGDTKEIESRKDLNRAYSFRSLASSQILGLLKALAGLGGLSLFLLRRKELEYLWFSLMMLLGGAGDWIYVSQSVLVWNVALRDFVNQTAWTGFALASLAFYHQLLQPRRTWLLKLAVASMAPPELIIFLACFAKGTMSTGFLNLISISSQIIVYAWIVSVVFTRARQNSVDARLLAAPVALDTSATLLWYTAWITYTFGWQHKFNGQVLLTENPFPVYLLDATAALFLLALFGILILRFTRTRSQEERFAGEVQSARSVQQYLIPAQLPPTPGFTIQSEYRPAREVGGDFFQVLPGQQDGSVLIVVGDVAGKGLEAGMLATLIVGAIRTAVAFTADPRRIIALLNERLQGRSLVTCLALRIERDGSATLVSAGHLPPYLNDKELPMEGAFPLGAVSGIEFPVMQFHLAECDSLMLMSDGVAEAQDIHGHLFGFERIGAMLSEGATAASLATAAQTFGQEDDITVISVTSIAIPLPAPA